METRILMVEDSEADAGLYQRQFARAGLSPVCLRVETAEDFEKALGEFAPDLVLSDFTLPRFDGLSALTVARKLAPDIPFVFVSGTIGEERAVEAMRNGATDYVLKDRLDRLIPVIMRAIEEAKMRKARRDAEHALRLTQFAVDHVRGAVLQIDARGLIHYANESACRMLGYPRTELLALKIDDIQPAMTEAAWSEHWESLKRSGSMIVESEYRTRDGRTLPVEISANYFDYEGREVGFNYVLDVSERKAAEQRIRYLVNYDGLTGLPNRELLQDRLRQAVQFAERYETKVAVLVAGLDRFKLVNDTLGHAAGDEVLKLFADRISGCMREADTVARIGGDEFVIVAAGAAQPSNGVVPVAQRILAACAKPIGVEGRELVITASLGVALYPNDGKDAQALLANAHSAMHKAKELGRNGYQFYTAEASARAHERLSLESGLRRALEQGELRLHFQPLVSLRTGQITGLEALLRWQHPETGLIPPARFIPIAEESGLIVPIGEWVLKAGCAQTQTWRAQGLAPIRISVNLSARQFRQRDLATVVARTLSQTGMDPDSLELELTESSLMHNIDEAIQVLTRLRASGAHISMDDFGTGYSSLSHLKRLPIDTLKIDQSFVREITSDPDSAAIADAIIAMARSLRLQVVAEGVETDGQLAILHARGCDGIQGYLFSKPLPPEDLEVLLRERRSLPLPDQPIAEGPTLLLVDDEQSVLAALRRALRGEGYRILVAGSPKDAFELLARNTVQVIISDQRMPDMSGTEFFGRVKALYPRTIRIMLSGYTELKALTDAINRGAIYKYLTKPWDDEQLREEIRGAFQAVGQRDPEA